MGHSPCGGCWRNHISPMPRQETHGSGNRANGDSTGWGVISLAEPHIGSIIARLAVCYGLAPNIEPRRTKTAGFASNLQSLAGNRLRCRLQYRGRREKGPTYNGREPEVAKRDSYQIAYPGTRS